MTVEKKRRIEEYQARKREEEKDGYLRLTLEGFIKQLSLKNIEFIKVNYFGNYKLALAFYKANVQRGKCNLRPGIFFDLEEGAERACKNKTIFMK